MKTTLVFMAVLAISGCATAPQGKKFTDCLGAISKDQAYRPLEGKMSLTGIPGQSLEMLSNKDRASESEKPLISRWSAARKQCYADSNQDMQQSMHPKMYALIVKAESQRQQLAYRLYSGAITYGEFADGRQIIQDIFEQSRTELEANSVDQQAEQRRQVLLMQWQALQNKPAPAPAPMPYMIPTRPAVTTNCTTVAGQVNCVSR